MTDTNNEALDKEEMLRLASLVGTDSQYATANFINALDRYSEQACNEARVDELNYLYLRDIHFGCGKNDEEFVRGSDPKDQCCYCYPHKSCVMYKGYEAVEKVINNRLAQLTTPNKAEGE